MIIPFQLSEVEQVRRISKQDKQPSTSNGVAEGIMDRPPNNINMMFNMEKEVSELPKCVFP